MSVRITITERGLDRIFGSVQRWARRSEGAVGRSLGKLAHELRRDIVSGVRNQNPGGLQFKPLAASTRRRKGSSKALIDKGDLVRSVNVTKLGKLDYFVGVHRKVKTKDGKSMANLAEIHEFGSKKVKDRPPARPFLRPSYYAWRYEAQTRFAKMIAKELGLPLTGSMAVGIGSRLGGISFGGD